MTNKLANAQTTSADGNGGIVNCQRVLHERGTWQVSITVAATVKLQGRSDQNAPWVDVASLTATGGGPVDIWPQMQAVITGNTGTVNAWLND